MIKFKSAVVDLQTNMITMFEQFGEVFDFDMNEYKNGLPEYANKQFEQMKFENQIGNKLFYR